MVQFNELELTKWESKKPQYQNLTEQERDALQDLRSRHDIIIKPADKGSAVVIMDISDYLVEGTCQLEDRTDLTMDHKVLLSNTIDAMVKRGEIACSTADYLIQLKPRTAQLYLLPKIHKQQRPPPGRPIISANECPTERISEFADFFLQPFLPEIDSYLKDTADFLLKLEQVGKVKSGSHLVAADITSLYKNIPHIEPLMCIARFLKKHRKNGKKSQQ